MKKLQTSDDNIKPPQQVDPIPLILNPDLDNAIVLDDSNENEAEMKLNNENEKE